MHNPYKLPETMKPEHYIVHLKPDFQEFTFSGKVEVAVHVHEETNTVVLNVEDLKVSSASVMQKEILQEGKGIIYDADKQTISFTVEKNITKGKATLKLEFSGILNDIMRGFYRSTFTHEEKKYWMATTQFEPNDARMAFPCFDEPALKARFKVTLEVPKDMTAISNMPVENESIANELKIVEFKETPIMSTYLLAFIVGNFEWIETTTKEGTQIRIITTPGKKEQGGFALETTEKILKYYNEYFGVQYVLPKIDLIAIPDFAAGAMENWGAITYRETALLFDETQSSKATQQRVALVIAHELAHQWFGNLVTMQWWNDLWLNEGFASWMEYKALNHVFPKWNIWTQFLLQDTFPAMGLDGLQNSHAIEVEVRNPNEIGEIFDAVSYSKGASIIRMLENFVGDEVFQKGLQHYIDNYKYGNTETKNLWEAIEEVSNKPVEDIMNSWTKQVGYPLVEVKEHDQGLHLTQERFLYEHKEDATLWKIPVAVQTGKAIVYTELMEKETAIAVPETTETVLINPMSVGFYRVHYDAKLFESIIDSVEAGKVKELDKVSLQSNAYALTRAIKTPATSYLELAQAFKNTKEYTVWAGLTAGLGSMNAMFAHEDFKEDLKAYIRAIYPEILEYVGWDTEPGESHTDSLLRSTVLAGAGFNETPSVLEEAKKRFAEHVKGNLIAPDIRGVVFALTAWQGSQPEFETMKELYLKAERAEEKVRLLYSMGDFKEEKVLKQMLEFNLSEHVRSQDAVIGMVSVGSNSFGEELAWNFFKENVDEFYKRYAGGTYTLARLISDVAQGSTQERHDDVENFFKQHPADNAKRAIQQALERIRINKAFMEFNTDKVRAWLVKH